MRVSIRGGAGALRRRWLDSRLRTKGLLVVSIPILPLLLLVITYSVDTIQRNYAESEQNRMHRAETELQGLIADLSGAETATREFVLTGEEHWSRDLEAARTKALERLLLLDAVIVNPVQRTVFEKELAPAAKTRLEALRHIVTTAGLLPEQRRELVSDGQRALHDLRQLAARMVELQRHLVEDGNRRARTRQSRSTILFLLITIAGVGGGILAAVLMSRGIVARISEVAEDAARLESGEALPATTLERDEIGALRRRLSSTGELLRDRNGQIERAKQELDSFFTITPDLLCLANAEGKFTRVNPAWDALGWSEKELTTVPFLDFVHPDDREPTSQQAARLAEGDSVVSFENRYATADGSYRWLSWHARLDSGTGLIAAVARDITQRRDTESRLQELNRQLKVATHAKNEFLSRISHDLRTPLNAIRGFAQLLEADSLDAKQRDNVQQILNGSHHLLQLIDEVLQITRAETGNMPLSLEPLPVADVVNRVVALVRTLAEARGLSVSVDVGAHDWVKADRQRLSDILLNLLSNAVKYNGSEGKIHVHSCRRDGQMHISVSDTGEGISADKLARLFVPFDRLGAEHGPEEGTGLGLALAKTLAVAMHGDLVAESTLGVGSTLRIELPTADALVNEADALQRIPPATPQATRGRVLYIDDTPSNLLLVRRALERRAGVELLTASCGEEGLRVAAGGGELNLILLDLHLPDMQGEQVLEHLRQRHDTRGIPVVVVSADAMPVTAERLGKKGAVGYLSKPLDIRDLLCLIDEYCQAA